MSNHPADLSAAPVEYFGLKLHPLRIQDWGELDRWMKQTVMDDVLEAAQRKKLEGELLTKWLVAGQMTAERTSTATTEGMVKLNSFQGFLKIIELSSRGGFTAEKRAEVMEHNLQDMVEQAANTILNISQPDMEVSNGDEAAGQPKKKD